MAMLKILVCSPLRIQTKIINQLEKLPVPENGSGYRRILVSSTGEYFISVRTLGRGKHVTLDIYAEGILLKAFYWDQIKQEKTYTEDQIETMINDLLEFMGNEC